MDKIQESAADSDADTTALYMLRTMAEMQDEHNRRVHPNWRAQDYEYYRAIWVECAELLDHFGWKWWKKQVPDLAQVKLEIVDIWHFGLSEMLRARQLNDDCVTVLVALETATETDVAAFRAAVEKLARVTLTKRSFDIDAFAGVMRELPMSFGELFDLYVGKNVLNNFRQDHGYKSGEYRKIWSNREDNEHLVEVLEELDCPPAEVPDVLYAALEARYPG